MIGPKGEFLSCLLSGTWNTQKWEKSWEKS